MNNYLFFSSLISMAGKIIIELLLKMLLFSQIAVCNILHKSRVSVDFLFVVRHLWKLQIDHVKWAPLETSKFYCYPNLIFYVHHILFGKSKFAI